MISYKDMTFCASDCQNTACHRFFSEAEQRQAEKWWGGVDAPIAFADFSATCKEYKK